MAVIPFTVFVYAFGVSFFDVYLIGLIENIERSYTFNSNTAVFAYKVFKLYKLFNKSAKPS